MIVLLALLLPQEPPPAPPPTPRTERAERLKRELEALPPDAPARREKEAELRRLLGREPQPPPRASFPTPGEDPFRPPAVEEPESVKAWLKEHEPETFRRLERATAEGRRPEVARLLADAEPRMREMEELKARDPRAFEKLRELRRLERESLDLAERVRAAAPADRETGAKKLRESLDRLFELREEAKARELEELKRRVAELERQLEARKAAKERIVERRKRDLLGERLPDDW